MCHGRKSKKCYGRMKENKFVKFKGNLWGFLGQMAFKLTRKDKMGDMGHPVMSKRSISTKRKIMAVIWGQRGGN